VGLTRSSFVRAMVFHPATKFLPGSRWCLGSLEFITNKFWGSKSAGTRVEQSHQIRHRPLPLDPVRVDLVSEAQLVHGLTPWLSWWPQQIQLTSHHHNLTLRTTVNSIWWAKEIHPLQRPPKKSIKRQKRRWHGLPIWPGSSIKGRGITACRMTLGH
jgi:hypothetical protein